MLALPSETGVGGSESEVGMMTAGELVRILRTYPKDTLVCVEGCDCLGFAVGVKPFAAYKLLEDPLDFMGEWMCEDTDIIITREA